MLLCHGDLVCSDFSSHSSSDKGSKWAVAQATLACVPVCNADAPLVSEPFWSVTCGHKITTVDL